MLDTPDLRNTHPEDFNELRDVVFEIVTTPLTVAQQAVGSSCTATTTLIRKVKRSTAASVTASASLNSAGPTVTEQDLGSSVTGGGVVGEVGVLVDGLAATVVPQGSLSVQVISSNEMNVGGSVTPTATVQLIVRKTLSGVCQSFANVVRRPQLAFGASVSVSSGLALITADPGAVFTFEGAASVTPTAAITSARVRLSLAAQVTPASMLFQRLSSITVTASCAPSGSVALYQPPPPPVIDNPAQLILAGGYD